MFLWQHKILDEPGCDFLLQDSVYFESLHTVFTVPELPRCNFTGCKPFASVTVRVSNANSQDKLDDFSCK